MLRRQNIGFLPFVGACCSRTSVLLSLLCLDERPVMCRLVVCALRICRSAIRCSGELSGKRVSRADQAGLVGDHDQLRAVSRTEFRHRPVEVRLRCQGREVELGSDVFIG